MKVTWRTDMRAFNTFAWREPGGFACDDYEDGAAQWFIPPETDKLRYLDYICPCGCKDWRSIPVEVHDGNGWLWDGNETEPTLVPSILHNPGEKGVRCHWHGYLTRGEWITA